MSFYFNYKVFWGTKKEDLDEWLEDFEGTAKANGKWDVHLSTLSRVLQGEARPWFNEKVGTMK